MRGKGGGWSLGIIVRGEEEGEGGSLGIRVRGEGEEGRGGWGLEKGGVEVLAFLPFRSAPAVMEEF